MMRRRNAYTFVIGILLLGNLCISQTALQRADSLKQAGNYKEALKVFTDILEKDLKESDQKQIGRDYNNVANVYSDMGDYEKSSEYYFKALKITETLNDKPAMATQYYNIANNYYAIGKLDHCEEFLSKAMQAVAGEKNNEFTLALCNNMLGAIKTDKKKYTEAKEYMLKAEGQFKTAKHEEWLANLYTNLSYLELERKNYEAATLYARKSLAEFENQKDPVGMATAYVNLYKAKFDPVDTGKLSRNTIKDAMVLLDSAQKALDGISSPVAQIRIFEHKQYVYGRLGEFDSAFVYQRKFWLLKDSINNEESKALVEELQVKYDVSKKEQENALLQQTNRKQFYLLMALGIALVAAGIIAFLILRVKKLKSEQKETELQQKLLRLQMNPHFLFNAITSIQKYVLNKDTQEAYDYLARFAKLIRVVLNNSQEKSLMLSQELEMLRLYIEVEQMRFKSFDFVFKMDDNVEEFDIPVPSMLIQPYIENAIWHGLMNLQNERRGILSLNISRQDNILRIIIEDNGVGRERAKAYRKEDAHKSVGMELTEQRLLMINKAQKHEQAKVLVNDVLDKNDNVCGTKVEIYIPINGK